MWRVRQKGRPSERQGPMIEYRGRFLASLFVCVLLLVAGLPVSRAQITLDGSMGPAGPLAGPDYRIDAGVGQMRGSNLFHSFAEFNVRAGESATFRGPGPVDNIIGRVTGGHPSVVDGRVRSEIPDANVYLLNPRGVVFGPDASLEIDVSFHVSTADYLRFADGGAFYADPAKAGVLSVAPPEAFGFLGETPAGIAVRGGQLGVPGDKTLSVIGGNVRVEGGMVSAPGGQVNIASVASAGEVSLRDVDASTASFRQLGEMHMTAGTTIDVSGRGAGAVVIRAGRLVMDNAAIEGTTGEEAGEGITVGVTDELILDNGAVVATQSAGAGSAGEVSVRAGKLVLANASGIFSLVNGAGSGGDVTVTATESARLLTASEISSIALDGSTGGAGAIAVRAPTLEVGESAVIDARTLGDGDAGNVSVAVNRLVLTAGGQVGSGSGIASVETGEVRVGKGQAGTVTITATDSVTMSGQDAAGIASGIFSQTAALCEGAACGSAAGQERRAGMIAIATPTLRMNDGARVGTDTASGAPGGDIEIRAETLSLSGGAQVSSESGIAVGPRVFVGTGRGGDITIQARNLNLDGRAAISARSAGPGDAGTIRIAVGDSLVSRNSAITTEAERAGGGGEIDVEAGSMVQLTGSHLTTTVRGGAGDAGDITVDPRFVILNDSRVIANAFEGRGGNIRITAGVFLASPFSTLDASSQLGVDGTVDVRAPVNEISGTFAPLPTVFLDATDLLREHCARRLQEGKYSSFVVGGRDGVPLGPDGFLPSPLPWGSHLSHAGPRGGEPRSQTGPQAGPRDYGRWRLREGHTQGLREVRDLGCPGWRATKAW